MKKISYIVALIILHTNILTAQVGINIKKPTGVFQIDAKSDTESAGLISDDIFVDANGNLGLGVAAPTHKLEVDGKGYLEGQTTIKDGSEGLSKFWVTDANGTGTWNNLNATKGLMGEYNRRASFGTNNPEVGFSTSEKAIFQYGTNGKGYSAGEFTNFDNNFFTSWDDNNIPMADRVPITGTFLENADSEMLYMMHSGQYLFWIKGFKFDYYYSPYKGQIYGIIRIRVGNTELGSTEGIIYEKEFFYNCETESFFVNLEVPSPYKWTPIYITFERYPLSPNLDWVTYPSSGTKDYEINAHFYFVKVDNWNLE